MKVVSETISTGCLLFFLEPRELKVVSESSKEISFVLIVSHCVVVECHCEKNVRLDM